MDIGCQLLDKNRKVSNIRKIRKCKKANHLFIWKAQLIKFIRIFLVYHVINSNKIIVLISVGLNFTT